MLYFLGSVIAVIGAAYFLSGSISLRKRDEHAIHHYSDDAYAQQTMNQMYQQHHQNPF